jgi:hypothetical protein
MLFIINTGFALGQIPMFDPPLSPRIANYNIDVFLDAQTKRLSATQIVRWQNDSNDEITDLQFHLYLNAFKNEQTTFIRESGGRLRGASLKKDGWGWITVTRVQRADGIELTDRIEYIQPDDGNEMDETVMRIQLDRSISPGEEIVLHIDFTAQLPAVFARSGYAGDFVMVGQWFPKIGVYEEAGERYATTGQWNCHQYHGTGEFYADYGVYDVNITVPEIYTVGATGILLETIDNEDGTKTWHYYCEDVHDFAWTADSDFIVFEDKWKHVSIKYLSQPLRDSSFERQIQAAKNALEYCDEWFGTYPYPTLTIVDPQYGGLGAGGMEYMTIFTAGNHWLAPKGIKLVEGVVIHEFAHNYSYGMIGNNETEEAWLDEGFTAYSEMKILQKYYGQNTGSVVDLFGLQIDQLESDWTAYSGSPMQDKIVKNAWEYARGGYGRFAYFKPSLLLLTLENYFGAELMKQIFRTYFDHYKYSHPVTADFIRTVTEVSGQDLSLFFDQVLFGMEELDYKLDRISVKRLYKDDDGIFGNPLATPDTSEPVIVDSADSVQDKNTEESYENKVVIERAGGVIFPVELLVTFADGHIETEKWDGIGRYKIFTYIRSSKLVSAQIDPDRKIWLDSNFLNNGKTFRQSRSAVLKYSTRWLFWMQNLLMMLSIFS